MEADLLDNEKNFVQQVIRRLRIDKGIKSKWLATKMNVAVSTYSALETGKRTMSVDHLSMILAAHQLSWAEFGQAVDAQAKGGARDAVSRLSQHAS